MARCGDFGGREGSLKAVYGACEWEETGDWIGDR